MTHRTEGELLTGVKEFDPRISDLKIDVFGPAAAATFILHYDVATNDDEQLSLMCRTTMVFVNDASEWKIAHKHLSGFHSNV